MYEWLLFRFTEWLGNRASLIHFFLEQYFQRDLPAKFEADPECYFTLAYSLRYNPKKMKKMEKEYTAMKTKEQEELVELKVNNTPLKFITQKVIFSYTIFH